MKLPDYLRNRPILAMTTGHWLSQLGLGTLITGMVTWVVLIPMHLRSGEENPYIGIAMFGVVPAVLVVGLMLTFLGLWLTSYGSTTLGMSPEDALSRGGMIIGISYMAAFAGAPVFGIMTDRMNRTTALMITLVIAFIGYGGTILVSDPFGLMMIGFMIFVGLSEVGCVITSGVLIAEQTPENIRGSVIGIFNLCGAIGILVASKLGGYLYDHWTAAGPFFLFGMFALFVFIWALLVRSRLKPVNPGAGKDHALDDQAQEAVDIS